jgi:hypothetical protein
MSLGVDREPAAGGVERGVLSQAGEYVGGEAVFGFGVVHAAAGEQRQAAGGGEIAEERDLALLAAAAVTLDFDVEPVAAEDIEQLLQRRLGRGRAAGTPGAPHRAVLVAGERDQALVIAGEFVPGGEARPLAVARVDLGREVVRREAGGARGEFRLGDELAEILVALLRGGEQRQHAAVGERDLGTDPGAQAGFAGGAEEPRRAAHAVAVEQRDGGQAEFARDRHEILG